MRQHPCIIHINRALERQFRVTILVNSSNRSTLCTYVYFRSAKKGSQAEILHIIDVNGNCNINRSSFLFYCRSNAPPESLNGLMISVINLSKARGSRPRDAEKNGPRSCRAEYKYGLDGN